MRWKRAGCMLGAVLLCTGVLWAVVNPPQAAQPANHPNTTSVTPNTEGAHDLAAPPAANAGEAPAATSLTRAMEHSVGRAPVNPGLLRRVLPLGSTPRAPTDVGWGEDASVHQCASFILNAPGTLTQHGPTNAPRFLGAGDFGPEQTFEFMYVLESGTPHYLYTMSTSTGALTQIGSAVPQGGQTWTGMAWDDVTQTMYASSTNLSASGLYTINLDTGAATYIGPMTGSPGNIALAVNCDGEMYAYDIVNDDFGSVNKATGAYTSIGPLGFNANFGQGMDFDDDDGQLYMAAFNNDTFQAELRIVNVANGSSTLVGAIGTPGSTQLGFLGIDQECGPYVPKYGACCDEYTGVCTDGVEIRDCPSPLRFAQDTLCVDLDPNCGDALGACCVNTICVATNTEPECAVLGGDWYIGEDCDAGYECPGACPEATITVVIATDSWGYETSWEVIEYDTGAVMGTGAGYESNQTYIELICVPYNSCFYFNIYDSYGDGTYAPGGYAVSYEGVEIYSCLGAGWSGLMETVEWIGDDCHPPTGACCVGGECLATNTEAECEDLMGGFPDAWYEGEDCDAGFQCPSDPCADAIYDNGGDDGRNGLACDRRTEAGNLEAWVVDDVTFIADANITDVHWFAATGTSYSFADTGDLIVLASDGAGGSPGTVVYELSNQTTTRVYAGYDAYGRPVYQYSIVGIDLFVPAGAYWIGMRPVNQGTSEQSFWQTAADNGTADIHFKSAYFGYPNWVPGINIFGEEYNVSFCITGYYGEPPVGACCDDWTGICNDDVEFGDCLPPLRFTADTLCADLDPLCGEIPGACCYDDGTCELTTYAGCIDGDWLGPDTTCDMCPCIVACPEGGVPEDESCGSNTNGGCNSSPPVFESINIGDTICGTGWFDGGTRDTDWYEVVVSAPIELTFTVEAEFEVLFGFIEQIVPGVPGCDNITGYVAPYAIMPECSPESLVYNLPAAGTYYLFVAPTFAAPVECPAAYVATLSGPGWWCDFDGDGDVDNDDYWIFADAFGTCTGDPKYLPEADTDGDNCITLVDYQAWVECFRDANPGKQFPLMRKKPHGETSPGGGQARPGRLAPAPPRP